MTEKEPKLKEEIRDFAKEQVDFFKIKTLKDTKDIICYQNGVYVKGEEILQKSFDVRFREDATPSRFNTFLHFIRSRSYFDRKDFIEPENKINLNNCVLNIITKKVSKHSPDYNFMYKLPIDYDENAKCPEIINFLHSITRSQKDYDCVVEMIGYTLMSGMKFHNIFMFVGTGSNGKSKLIQLIQELIGKSNCSNISIQDLANNRFAKADLYGKKANLCSDIPDSVISSSGILKGLTGEDTVWAEEKGKKGFSFFNTAKLIFSGNNLPEIKDKSPAMWNRFILLEFPNVFRGSKEDKGILSKLTTHEEMSGLLNLALEGIERLLKNKSFSYEHGTTLERWDGYRNNSNPISAFFKECIVFDDSSSVSKKDALTLYKNYCSYNGIVPASDKMFNIHMKQYLHQDFNFRPIDESRNRTWMWKGIRISNNWIAEFHKKQSPTLHI